MGFRVVDNSMATRGRKTDKKKQKHTNCERTRGSNLHRAKPKAKGTPFTLAQAFFYLKKSDFDREATSNIYQRTRRFEQEKMTVTGGGGSENFVLHESRLLGREDTRHQSEQSCRARSCRLWGTQRSGKHPPPPPQPTYLVSPHQECRESISHPRG